MDIIILAAMASLFIGIQVIINNGTTYSKKPIRDLWNKGTRFSQISMVFGALGLVAYSIVECVLCLYTKAVKSQWNQRK